MTNQQAAIERVRSWIDGGCSSWGVPVQSIEVILASLPTDDDDSWQPIETAPKDGDDILVLWRDHGAGCLVVSWNDEPKQPGWQWATLDGLNYHNDAFSHWMPPPKPPEQQP